ncbi:BCCT, betaine/carnitine/choline family transporter [Aureococcus anophagefferens]|nr:BCCT, betaine/carnitine/choline family transporter [Aureococcus anophagefferens]
MSDGASNFRSTPAALYNMQSPYPTYKATSVSGHGKDVVDADNGARAELGLDLVTATFAEGALGFTCEEQLDAAGAPSLFRELAWALPSIPRHLVRGALVRVEAHRFGPAARDEVGMGWRSAFYYGTVQSNGDIISVLYSGHASGQEHESHFSHVEIGTRPPSSGDVDDQTLQTSHEPAVVASVEPLGAAAAALVQVGFEVVDTVCARPSHHWNEEVAGRLDALLFDPANQRRYENVYNALKSEFEFRVDDERRPLLPPRKAVETRMLNIWKKTKKEARDAAQNSAARDVARAARAAGVAAVDDDEVPSSGGDAGDPMEMDRVSTIMAPVPGRGISLPNVTLGNKGSFWFASFNPYVTFYSIAIIWSFIAFTLSERWQAYKEFQMWFQWVTDEWTWLYIGSQNIWIAMLLYFLCVPKYRNIKLGKDTDEPEFSYLQWFSMVFAAGVAVGLFFFGVAEPMSNHALMVTYFHWGLHGWVPYCLIGALMSLMAYRRDLPLSMRSCLYPLWGKGIEGWKGDAIDVLSIVCTLFGVCTSLGIGVRQLNVGLIRLDRGTYAGEDLYGSQYDFAQDGRGNKLPDRAFCSGADCHKGRLGIRYDTSSQSAIIAGVTLLATCSVVLGLKNGIARLSRTLPSAWA